MPDESKRVEKVDTKGLEAAILKAHGEGGVPLIIDFYAHWCGPCMVLGRTLDKLAVAMGDAVDIVKVRERHCTRASAQGSLVPV